MRKLLCLIDALSSGGAERQMIGLASQLKAKGYEVNLATYLHSDFYLDLVRQSGVTLLALKSGSSKLSKFLAVRRCVQRGGYDVVIAYKEGATMLACLLKLSGCHLSTIVSERYTTQTITKRDKIKFFLYRFADYIVPNSYSQERFIKKNYPYLSDKICTITNFTDTDYFKPADSGLNNPLRILTAARVAEQKNIKRYLMAIRLLKDSDVKVKFIWIGRVEEKQYAEDCIRMISELNLSDMIDFKPATSHIVDEYHKCDIVCLPSVYEGYPNVICEAMSCGKPILCSNICDNPQIVENGVNGFIFDPKDVDDIAVKIKKLCDMNRDDLEEMGRRNRSVAIKKFSPEVFVSKYINLIEQ